MADQRLASPTALRSMHVEAAICHVFGIGSPPARASTVWPTASLAICIPVPCPGPFTVKQFACENGAAVSGNVDMGLYTPEGQLIISTGATAHAGTATWQTIDVADTEIPPGWYYLAMSLNNTTGTNIRQASTGIVKRMYGVRDIASASPLPTTATFQNPVDGIGYWPTMQAMGVTTL